MRRTSTGVLPLFAAAIALAVGLPAGALAQPAPNEANHHVRDGETSLEGAPTPAFWNLPQLDAYNAIQTQLERDPATSGGVSANGTDRLVVHLLDGLAPTDGLEVLVAAARATGATVEFDHVQRSLAQLSTLQSFGSPDGACDSSVFAATRVVTCAISPDTNSVEVSVAELTPDLTVQVSARFGPAVTVVQGITDDMSLTIARLPLAE